MPKAGRSSNGRTIPSEGMYLGSSPSLPALGKDKVDCLMARQPASVLTNICYNKNMKTAILIHGYYNKSEFEDVTRPAASNDHWFPWVQRQLLLKGIETQTPEMPGFFAPNYKKWKKMLENFSPDENTILIGHSCGGGFLVRWLSENNVKVGKVVLVAPWLDLEKESKNIDPEFFNFEIDPNIAQKTEGLTIMYSTDDHSSIQKSIEILKSKLIGAKFVEFTDKGHFTLSSLKTEEFPELLHVVLN